MAGMIDWSNQDLNALKYLVSQGSYNPAVMPPINPQNVADATQLPTLEFGNNIYGSLFLDGLNPEGLYRDYNLGLSFANIFSNRTLNQDYSLFEYGGLGSLSLPDQKFSYATDVINGPHSYYTGSTGSVAGAGTFGSFTGVHAPSAEDIKKQIIENKGCKESSEVDKKYGEYYIEQEDDSSEYELNAKSIKIKVFYNYDAGLRMMKATGKVKVGNTVMTQKLYDAMKSKNLELSGLDEKQGKFKDSDGNLYNFDSKKKQFVKVGVLGTDGKVVASSAKETTDIETSIRNAGVNSDDYLWTTDDEYTERIVNSGALNKLNSQNIMEILENTDILEERRYDTLDNEGRDNAVKIFKAISSAILEKAKECGLDKDTSYIQLERFVNDQEISTASTKFDVTKYLGETTKNASWNVFSFWFGNEDIDLHDAITPLINDLKQKIKDKGQS